MASVLGVLLLGGVYATLESAANGGRLMSDRVAAYGHCRNLYEQMRGAPFNIVTSGQFPTQELRLTHLGGERTAPIFVTLSNRIETVGSPLRKNIEISAHWTYRGRPMVERLSGSIVDRNALVNWAGALDGHVLLNPDSGNVGLFELHTLDGHVIDADKLNSPDFAGFNGQAHHLTWQTDSGGVQTTLQYNFRTHPLSNGRPWSATGDVVDVHLTREDGVWHLGLRGAGVVLSGS